MNIILKKCYEFIITQVIFYKPLKNKYSDNNVTIN